MASTETTQVASVSVPPAGIASGVDRQVDDDALEPTSERTDTTPVLIELQHEIDVLAEQRAQHLGNLVDDLVHRDHNGRPRVVLPAERHQFVDQGAGPPHGRVDPLGVDERGLTPEVVDQILGMAEDRRQDIVEVVGNPAGQPTEGVHLLRLRQLPLEMVTLRLVVIGQQRLRALELQERLRSPMGDDQNGGEDGGEQRQLDKLGRLCRSVPDRQRHDEAGDGNPNDRPQCNRPELDEQRADREHDKDHVEPQDGPSRKGSQHCGRQQPGVEDDDIGVAPEPVVPVPPEARKVPHRRDHLPPPDTPVTAPPTIRRLGADSTARHDTGAESPWRGPVSTVSVSWINSFFARIAR